MPLSTPLPPLLVDGEDHVGLDRIQHDVADPDLAHDRPAPEPQPFASSWYSPWNTPIMHVGRRRSRRSGRRAAPAVDRGETLQLPALARVAAIEEPVAAVPIPQYDHLRIGGMQCDLGKLLDRTRLSGVRKMEHERRKRERRYDRTNPHVFHVQCAARRLQAFEGNAQPRAAVPTRVPAATATEPILFSCRRALAPSFALRFGAARMQSALAPSLRTALIRLVRPRRARPAVAAHPRSVRDLGLRDHAAADAGRHRDPLLRALPRALPDAARAGARRARTTCSRRGAASATTGARATCTRACARSWRATAASCPSDPRRAARCPASAATPRARSARSRSSGEEPIVDGNVARVLARVLAHRHAARARRHAARAVATRPSSSCRASGRRRSTRR